MRLNNIYNQLETRRHLFYYQDFIYPYNHIVEHATEIIGAVFRNAGKAFLAEYNGYRPIDAENRPFRMRHALSAFLLGHYFSENLFNKRDWGVFGREDWDVYPFEYIWLLLCLLHDIGYGVELDQEKKRRILNEVQVNNPFQINWRGRDYEKAIISFRKQEPIRSSIWWGPYVSWKIPQVESLYNQYRRQIREYYKKKQRVKFFDGRTYKYPTYKSETINKYFHFRLNEFNCLDHGIAGGYIFFDKIIANYIDAFERNNPENFNDFYVDERRYNINQFSIFGYVADCIISHGIWNGQNQQDIYRRYGLDELIGNNYHKINIKENPYLFLLGLCDTIEPLKRFGGENILQDIDLQIFDNVISIEVLNNNFQDYFDRIKEMEEWLDVNVEQLHENIIKIHIKT